MTKHDSREALELHADGKSPLKLSQHVCRLAGVEGAAADEEDVVCVDIPILGGHHAALNDGQQVALHTLAARISACSQRVRLPATASTEQGERVLRPGCKTVVSSAALMHAAGRRLCAAPHTLHCISLARRAVLAAALCSPVLTISPLWTHHYLVYLVYEYNAILLSCLHSFSLNLQAGKASFRGQHCYDDCRQLKPLPECLALDLQAGIQLCTRGRAGRGCSAGCTPCA